MLFSASFYNISEEYERGDEIELFINLNINHKLKESDINNIDVKSQLEHQIQIQETKESGWIFDKINSMKIRFYKTGESNGSNFVKIPLRSKAILNNENIDKECFLWSILACLHPLENSHPTRVRNCLQYFIELNIEGFDFTNAFKCSDVHKYERLYNLSINIFQLIFYQDQYKWKHKLIPFENSKNESDRVVDLMIYRNHYVLIKKLNVFLGNHTKIFLCRRCLNSYASENMLMLHRPKCENFDITTIRTSSESRLHWKHHFHKTPLYFGIIAVFETGYEIDNSSIGYKTTHI